jgi:hypothetical protein
VVTVGGVVGLVTVSWLPTGSYVYVVVAVLPEPGLGLVEEIRLPAESN